MQDSFPHPAPCVLLVDDEPHITHILSRKLKALGAEVLCARNGAEGLELAMSHGPSVILSDLQMPKLDGLEMALQLAEHDSTATIPIIMISGRGYLLSDSRLQRTAIVEVLEKPFSVRAVIDLLKQVLSTSTDMDREQAA